MLSGTASPHLIFRVYFAFANDTAPWSARSSASQHVSSSASSKSGTRASEQSSCADCAQKGLRVAMHEATRSAAHTSKAVLCRLVVF